MNKTLALVPLLLVGSAACDGGGSAGTGAPTASSTARVAATTAASPAATATAAATAVPAVPATSSASGGDAAAHCVTSLGDKVTVRVKLDAPSQGSKGTVEIDGALTRRLDVTVQLYKATALLQFADYGKGDVTPPGEKLTSGKSQVARLVTIDNHEDLYFDVDLKLPGVDVSRPGRCTSTAARAACQSSKDCANTEVCVHALNAEGTAGSHACAKEVLSGNGQGVACLTDADCGNPRLKTIRDIAAFADGSLTCQKHDATDARICRPKR